METNLAVQSDDLKVTISSYNLYISRSQVMRVLTKSLFVYVLPQAVLFIYVVSVASEGGQRGLRSDADVVEGEACVTEGTLLQISRMRCYVKVGLVGGVLDMCGRGSWSGNSDQREKNRGKEQSD